MHTGIMLSVAPSKCGSGSPEEPASDLLVTDDGTALVTDSGESIEVD